MFCRPITLCLLNFSAKTVQVIQGRILVRLCLKRQTIPNEILVAVFDGQ